MPTLGESEICDILCQEGKIVQNRVAYFVDSPLVAGLSTNSVGPIVIVSCKLVLPFITLVQVRTPDSLIAISGGDLTASYKLAQFHFHWGKDERNGSEHLIDGMASPLEVL